MKRAEISNVGAVHIFIAHRIRRPTLSADLRVKKILFCFFYFFKHEDLSVCTRISKKLEKW
jgi:hypothetical protein